MLCLDETTPVIMALCLLGAVFLIVGSSLWGNGDYNGIRSQTVAGISLFCISWVLIGLAGLGCWCNRWFCTPERKSKLARRFYSGSGDRDGTNKKPGDAEAGGGAGEIDEDCGSLGSSFRSFRSFRRASSSRRQSRSAGSLRRDRIKPSQGAAAGAKAEEGRQEAAAPAAEAIPEQAEPSPAEVEAAAAAQSNHSAIPQTSIDDVSVGEESAAETAPSRSPGGTKAVAGTARAPSAESLKDSAPVSC